MWLHIKVLTTATDPSETLFSWDTNGIPFIIDNSATAVITNERVMFAGPLVPTQVTLETAEWVSTHSKLVSSIRIVLTDTSNQNHVDIITGGVYNSDTPLNIFGVLALGLFIGHC